MTSTLYYGSDQQSTSLEYWRLFSNNIVRIAYRTMNRPAPKAGSLLKIRSVLACQD